ncbi:MAG: pyridoxamine 5'-phosphate oxidase [Pseudomonadales bacterium]|nr:pyridoxamine 5'-phosphate oxidase [Pseudomonadales bacterium]
MADGNRETMTMDLAGIRREYLKAGLSRQNLLADPVQQLNTWLQQAISMELADPTAMILSTVSASKAPSQRIVLLKHLDEAGLVFYTNYASHKARDMAENQQVSLHFPWYAIERQVSVGGLVSKVSAEESDRYFSSRPRESQIAAWASAQSEPLSSRDELLQRYQQTLARFADRDVPRPEGWGGYRVQAVQFEFWQGGAHRLHDRFCYTRNASGSWDISRLSP